MSVVETRRWTAPNGMRYQLVVMEGATSDGRSIRSGRRLEFHGLEGQIVGDVAIPGYFSLSMADSSELEGLWRWAVGD